MSRTTAKAWAAALLAALAVLPSAAAQERVDSPAPAFEERVLDIDHERIETSDYRAATSLLVQVAGITVRAGAEVRARRALIVITDARGTARWRADASALVSLLRARSRDLAVTGRPIQEEE